MRTCFISEVMVAEEVKYGLVCGWRWLALVLVRCLWLDCWLQLQYIHAVWLGCAARVESLDGWTGWAASGALLLLWN